MSRTVRIFISSPGDVAQERDRAREVIDSLRRRYAKRFVLQPLFWEDLPLQADMSFQEGIDTVLSEKGVDIAVFILWSRLGSPLGALIRRPDGTEYRSGTEREYDLMIRAREQTREREGKARPALLVYTRRDEVSFNELLGSARGTAEKRRLLEQKDLVESFLQETFKDAETGTNVGAYFPFDRPVTFSQRLRVHLQSLLDERAGDLDQVVWDIEKKGPPFLGLEAFQTEHAEIFFGREGEILEARRALKSKAAEGCAFLLISGASGSGKSSLARAGLLPEIAQHEIGDGQVGWLPVVVTPSELGADPLSGLVLRLAAGDVLPGLRDQVASLDDLARDLAREPEMMFRHTIRKTLEEAGKRKGGKLRLLLLIDQFEELFTTAVERERLAAFLSFVEVLARSGDAWVVATARSDFYERLQQEPVLVRMKEGPGLFDLLPPGPDAIQRLIEEPARLAGLRFEERDGVSLASRLLRDAADHAELLPLLEFVLLELYRRRDAEGRLTYAAYEGLGTGESHDGELETGVIAGALAKRAEEVYSSLSPEAQGGLDRVLTRMVTFVEDASDEETEKPLRRYAPFEEFDRRSGDRLLVDAFVAARLFTTREREGRAVVTLAHEALLRAWPRAVAWRKNNIDFLRLRARIEGRMREGARLLEGDPLLPAAQAAVAARPEGFDGKQLQYVGECVNEAMARRRSRERLRQRVMAGLAGLTLLAVAGAGWALKREREAEMARREADLERQKTKEALASETESNKRMEEALASETKSNERLQARLLDLVGLERVSQSIVFNDPDRFVAKSSEKAIVPGTEIQAALLLGPGQLVLAQGSEVLFFDLERREEIRRFQFGERITALFEHSSNDHFLAVGSGGGQTRQSKIYLVPVAEGNDIECIFKSTDMKGLAYPVAFARGPELGTVLIAFGYDIVGHLGFEDGLPGNPEQSPDSQPDNDMEAIAVFRFEIDSRKVVLEGTAENFGRGGWDEVRDDVSKRFPAFAWPKADLDEEVYRKLTKSASPELKSGWAPLAHWEDQWAAVVLMQDIPEEDRQRFLRYRAGVPAAHLRLYDANSGELAALPNRSPGREALKLDDLFLEAAVCDARSLDHLSPNALAGLEVNKLVYHADGSVDGRNLILKAVNLNEFDRSVDRQTFLQSFQIRLILDDTTTLRTIPIERGSSEIEQHPDIGAPGDTLHVGLEGDVIFYVGRYRTYQGIVVYDGHSGKALYEIDSDTLGLSGANMIGDSFMETSGRLLVATQPGLLRVWRDESGKWVHSIERHP